MTTLYLIRHAEAEGNLYRSAQGQYNSLLTDRGWRQVAALQKRFDSVRIDAVYASDLYRTVCTASAIYEPKKLPLHRRRALREIFVGPWETRAWGDIARTDAEQLRLFTHDPAKWYMEGAETALEVQCRVLAAVLKIAREHNGEHVAVVTHGYAIRMLLAGLDGSGMLHADTSPHGANTSVTKLLFEGGKLRAEYQNDISHLADDDGSVKKKQVHRPIAMEPGLWFEGVGQETAAALFPDAPDPMAGKACLVGYLGEKPAGVLSADPTSGFIFSLYVKPDLREQGYGAQLLGQAVRLVREHGGSALHINAPASDASRVFLKEWGFFADGAGIVTKDIAFDPRYLDPPGDLE